MPLHLKIGQPKGGQRPPPQAPDEQSEELEAQYGPFHPRRGASVDKGHPCPLRYCA